MAHLNRHDNTGRQAERGTALIEFTLVLPMLLVMTVAAVEFGRAFFVKNVVAQAARAGVRRGTPRLGCCPGAGRPRSRRPRPRCWPRSSPP